MDQYQWFKQARFGMMIHWGLYCLPAGEWKGQRTKQIGEWLQAEYRIPNAEYNRLAKVFNPILFDADEWAQLAVDAGMQYMVVTAKHHEGFAMYHSKVDAFNVVDATPFGRDVIGELANACAKRNLKLGLYYSQEIDWNDPDGGGYTRTVDNFFDGSGVKWDNRWDYPDIAAKNYTRCFERKIKPQVREILTQYGDLCLIWFDTPHTISPEQSRELVDMVHTLQPNCLVNSRIGNGMGDYGSMNDNQKQVDDRLEGLYESPITLNDTWGYKSFDNHWKSADEVIELKNYLNGRGVNMLLNVGPDALGRIPAPAADVLREVGRNPASCAVK